MRSKSLCSGRKEQTQQTYTMLHESEGILRYSPGKLIVEVDPDIAFFYRSLIPKWHKVNPQMYAPHISVVRKEVPPNMKMWSKYEGQTVKFNYDSTIYSGEVYWWLNVFSKRLEAIRLELGLPVDSPYTRPPAGFAKTFHITIGNKK